jgi:hypothetical protein
VTSPRQVSTQAVRTQFAFLRLFPTHFRRLSRYPAEQPVAKLSLVLQPSRQQSRRACADNPQGAAKTINVTYLSPADSTASNGTTLPGPPFFASRLLQNAAIWEADELRLARACQVFPEEYARFSQGF